MNWNLTIIAIALICAVSELIILALTIIALIFSFAKMRCAVRIVNKLISPVYAILVCSLFLSIYGTMTIKQYPVGERTAKIFVHGSYGYVYEWHYPMLMLFVLSFIVVCSCEAVRGIYKKLLKETDQIADSKLM